MKKSFRILCLAAAVCLSGLLFGCKAQDEIVYVPTPKPESQRVVINNQGLEPEHTITVHGDGEVIASPDYATITLKVSSRGDTAEEASTRCSEQMQVVQTTAAELAVEESDSKLSAIEITAITKEDGTVTGYSAGQTVTYSVSDTPFVNSITSTLVDTGVAEIVSVSYSLLDSSGAYRLALAAAMEDARSKAETIAESADVHIGQVIFVDEEEDSQATPRDTAFESSEIFVSASVTVTFKIS